MYIFQYAWGVEKRVEVEFQERDGVGNETIKPFWFSKPNVSLLIHTVFQFVCNIYIFKKHLATNGTTKHKAA
jgi:hypothetical protein